MAAELSRAWHTAFSGFALTCLAVVSQFPSARLSTALRCVRTGRFDKLRLMHLIDADDGGATTEQPFKGLEASGSPSEDLRACLTRLRRAIKYGTPRITNKASDWIDEFEKMLCKALKRGVSTKACGKFYRACMFKVSAPVLRYVGGAGRNCAATFDMAFLKEQSEARDEFKDAFYTRSRADDADDSDVEEIAPPAKAGRKRDRKGNPKAKAKATTTAQPQGKKALTAAALAKYNAEAPKRLAGVAAGAHVALPSDKSDASFTTFKKDHPPFEVPNVGKRPVCWNFVHPQGCNKRGKCIFAHPH